MNTLPRAVTAHILGSPSHFPMLRSHWSALMRSPRKHELAAVHHLVYLALIGKDWRRGFAPITNRRKLENGNFYCWKLFKAIQALHTSSLQDELLAPFNGLVTPRMIQQVRAMIPYNHPSTYKPEQFAAGFPFEAYTSLPDMQAIQPDEVESHD